MQYFFSPQIGSWKRMAPYWDVEHSAEICNPEACGPTRSNPRAKPAWSSWGGALAMKTFTKQSQNLHICLQMDSTSAVTYINRMRGTHLSTLLNMACSLWQWCLQRGITLSAEHLQEFTTADAESRNFHSSAEWQLLPSVFTRINILLGPCQMDLFATRLNHQLP